MTQPNVPQHAVETFLKIDQASAGERKNNSVLNQQKKEATNVLIQWMQHNNVQYISADNKYIVLKESVKLPPMNDELVGQCFLGFHEGNHNNGTHVANATKFLEFITQFRNSQAEKTMSLKLQKKKPMSARLQMILTTPSSA
jgi:hypothetical protein